MVKVAEAWVPVDDTTGANGVGNGTAGPVHGGGVVSETTMAFATIVWGAMPLPVGTRNGGVSGDRVDGWFIKDAAVVYNTESTPRPTGRDDDLVSTGFAMDNNMEHLKHSVTHEQYTVTEAAPSAEEAGSAEETVDAAGMEAGSHVPVRGVARQAGRSTRATAVETAYRGATE